MSTSHPVPCAIIIINIIRCCSHNTQARSRPGQLGQARPFKARRSQCNHATIRVHYVTLAAAAAAAGNDASSAADVIASIKQTSRRHPNVWIYTVNGKQLPAGRSGSDCTQDEDEDDHMVAASHLSLSLPFSCCF